MHAYDITGKPVYDQPTKKGAKNPTKPTSLANMKEQQLFPSVTEYIRMLSAPGLERYKQMQIVQACYHCPPIADEDLPTYQTHILESSGQDAKGAADLGTQIHDSLERYFTEPLLWKGTELLTMPNGAQVEEQEFVLPAVAKMGIENIKVTNTELVVVNPADGYAGKTDIVGSRHLKSLIADFKSTRTKPGKDIEPIETHPVQVAAYHKAVFGGDWENAIGANIYISTIEVGRVDIVTWDGPTLKRSWEIFEHCLDVFRWRTGYDARRDV